MGQLFRCHDNSGLFELILVGARKAYCEGCYAWERWLCSVSAQDFSSPFMIEVLGWRRIDYAVAADDTEYFWRHLEGRAREP